jgi:hypothetical protein
MNMRVLTLAVAGGAMLLSAPLATSALADNMVDGNKCQLYVRDLNWDLMLLGEASSKYATGSSALEAARAAQEKGNPTECVETAVKGIEDIGLPVNSYPEG